MKIIIDVDGTICDTHSPWLGRYNADYNDRLRKIDIVKWEVHELVKPECGMKIYDYLSDMNIYRKALPIEGALVAVRKLRGMGHEVAFGTSGVFTTKIDWLFDNGFSIDTDRRWPKDIIIASDKSWLCSADVIIDDYPKNLADFKHGILFDQPWNRECHDYDRAGSWNEVVQLIDSYRETAP